MSVYTHPVPRALSQTVRQLGLVRRRLRRRIPGAVPRRLGAGLQHDVFYLVYFAVASALIASYVRSSKLKWPRCSAAVGAGASASASMMAAFLVFNVYNTEDATARPHGALFRLRAALARSRLRADRHATADGFPCLVAYTLLHGKVGGFTGKLRFTALALPLVMTVTATYHLGYPQYRHDGLSRPETGNVLISIPTFATANPVGSFVAHASQHIAAVTHTYESRIFNPPVTKE